jgi:hypothetical protein
MKHFTVEIAVNEVENRVTIVSFRHGAREEQ